MDDDVTEPIQVVRSEFELERPALTAAWVLIICAVAQASVWSLLSGHRAGGLLLAAIAYACVLTVHVLALVTEEPA